MRIKQQNGVVHERGRPDMLTNPIVGLVSSQENAVVSWNCALYKGADLCVNRGQKLRLCRVRLSDQEEYEQILYFLLPSGLHFNDGRVSNMKN